MKRVLEVILMNELGYGERRPPPASSCILLSFPDLSAARPA
jgi:hypothetical protein